MMKIISITKIIWRLIVDISGVVSCCFTILSCYIAYTAVSEIITLNVEIAPIVEQIKRDSIVIEKRTVITEMPTKPLQPGIYKDIEFENDSHLSSVEIDSIISHREKFLNRMRNLFNK